MKTYKQYLEEQNYSPSTIESYTKAIAIFIKWCARNHTSPLSIDYKMCLKYIKYLSKKDTTKRTVNHRLGALKIYFNYIIDQGGRGDNPIENTSVKGEKTLINHHLLEAEELEDLYYSFDTENYQEAYHKYTAKRGKIVVGLMVYQGLDTKDLKKLRLEHLQLNKGKIYVPSGKRSNAREIELKPWQIMELMEYLNEVRDKLLVRLKTDTDLLIPSGDRFVITHTIIKKLKKTNQKVINIHQIRASVITHWLKQYNLRKVQYLAGHRYISSTEKYLQDDLENLHEIVNNFHPIH